MEAAEVRKRLEAWWESIGRREFETREAALVLGMELDVTGVWLERIGAQNQRKGLGHRRWKLWAR